MTKIEQDAKRVNLYNAIEANLNQLVIHKTNVDYLTAEVNKLTEELRLLVEDTNKTEFTPEDFDAVLVLRDSKLPKVQIELVEFEYYTAPVIEEIPVIEKLVVEVPVVEEVITEEIPVVVEEQL